MLKLLLSPLDEIGAFLFLKKKRKYMNIKNYNNIFNKNLNELTLYFKILHYYTYVSIKNIISFIDDVNSPLLKVYDNIFNRQLINNLFNKSYYQLFFNNKYQFLNYYNIPYFTLDKLELYPENNNIYIDNHTKYYKYYTKYDNFLEAPNISATWYHDPEPYYEILIKTYLFNKNIYNLENNYEISSIIQKLKIIKENYPDSINVETYFINTIIYLKNLDINLLNSIVKNKTLKLLRIYYNNDNDINSPLILVKQNNNNIRYKPINILSFKKPSLKQNVIEIPLNLKIDDNTGLIFNTGNIDLELIFKY